MAFGAVLGGVRDGAKWRKAPFSSMFSLQTALTFGGNGEPANRPEGRRKKMKKKKEEGRRRKRESGENKKREKTRKKVKSLSLSLSSHSVRSSHAEGMEVKGGEEGTFGGGGGR